MENTFHIFCVESWGGRESLQLEEGFVRWISAQEIPQQLLRVAWAAGLQDLTTVVHSHLKVIKNSLKMVPFFREMAFFSSHLWAQQPLLLEPRCEHVGAEHLAPLKKLKVTLDFPENISIFSPGTRSTGRRSLPCVPRRPSCWSRGWGGCQGWSRRRQRRA